MSEMKHTPGPWLQDEEATVYAGNVLVADCETHHRASEECDANARLIAAAPDLLVACKRLLSIAENAPIKHPQQAEWRADAVRAVAKAIGAELP